MAEIGMAELRYKGGKIFILLSLLGTLYGGLEFWKKFTPTIFVCSNRILEYTEPDLSGFDKKIALVESNTNAQMEIVLQKVDGLKSELDIVLEEISLISQVSRELKDDLKTDLRN